MDGRTPQIITWLKQPETLARGRKNYLLYSNYDAAVDTAVMYSLLVYCKAADDNFHYWMVYVLSHIHDYNEDHKNNLAETTW